MSTVIEPQPALDETTGRTVVQAYGSYASDKPLEAIAIQRREPGPRDVQIEIAYCGVCHG